ncbi:metallophosphoesterase family protein [Sphingomonas bacterium]|uniref:metallophosphoesterase family protein n=1 Tax=Sphingomonas bacterium TaxID=1895847 RepID=UPI0015775466|nr:metallophosphoesterase family protein [Sphingomonas bacterium]
MRLPLPPSWRRTATQKPPRIYAIGDIHGRLDLFEDIIERIRIEVLDSEAQPTKIVILGDFVDRGPQSAQIIELLMCLRKERSLVVLKGNHEAIMVDALAGDYAALDLWLAHGGGATLRSFGIEQGDIDGDHGPSFLRTARMAIGNDVRRWLAQLPTWVRIGDYYLVHAGIMPGVALDQQTDEHRLWIGDAFTTSDADHGAVIVHGHTIYEEGVMILPNRIGVDTGAYRTGRLSAVGLGDGIWTITADGNNVKRDARAIDQ